VRAGWSGVGLVPLLHVPLGGMLRFRPRIPPGCIWSGQMSEMNQTDTSVRAAVAGYEATR